MEKAIIYSESVKAGRRIYYLDVKQTSTGDRYIAITESKKVGDGEGRSFEKHKIFLYKEDFDKFIDALGHVVEYAKTEGSTTSDGSLDK